MVNLVGSRSKLREINPSSIYSKVTHYFALLIAFFNTIQETIEQWVKDQGDGIVVDCDLVKINDYKSHSFYTVSSLEEFAKILDTEWDKKIIVRILSILLSLLNY